MKKGGKDQKFTILFGNLLDICFLD